ncbi:DUF4238 domain-containing protein [Shimia sediminis]|uniref:DUF4238 domain-containing protein n=1 Tax=Shimia sediminis TaxID=2497945 RepID=UPI000F8E38C3|nr:DUF4238 domain-containing protein [Shimia sediminis]
MARKDAKPEMQHVVPKAALLNNFAFQKTGQKSRHVFLFDRIRGKLVTGAPSVNNVLGQRNFYSATVGDSIYSIEQGLTDLEDAAAPIISGIVSDESLKNLSDEHRAYLSTFVAAQWLRSPRVRASQGALSEAIARKSAVIAPDASNLPEIEAFATKVGVKVTSIKLIADMTSNLAERLYSYRWLLHRAPKDQGFWVSDCPVVMHNEHDFGPYSNVGFGVSGVQITMPLSSEIALSIWHPRVVVDLEDGKKELIKSRGQMKATSVLSSRIDHDEVADLIESIEQKISGVESILNSLDNGAALVATPENMDHFNSLQYEWSQRFIASKRNDFSLAKRMFDDNPDGGVKFRVD